MDLFKKKRHFTTTQFQKHVFL